MSLLSEKYAGLISRTKNYKPEIPTGRFSDISSGYQTIPGGTEYNVDPSPRAKFSNLPESVGGGQYILDPEQRDSLVKSVRKYDPIQKNKLMGGLSSDFFQIDHKIPLWAGGSDNDANKERLNINDHERKTKVGTVARTLYYNDKLSLSGARAMVMGWKDRDVEGIELTENGSLSDNSTEALSKAIFYSQEWDKPKKVKVGWKDVWSEMKKNPLIRGAQSIASSFTGGWFKPDYAPVEEGKELEATVADVAGNLVGTVASFATAAGLIGKATKLLGVKNLFSGTYAYKNAKVAIEAGKTATSVGKIKVSVPIGAKALHSAGFFALYGQGTRDAFENDRVHRFISDAAFGSIVGVAGNTLKSYAGLAAGVYGLGVIEGATPKEALMNSAIMVGFHRLGQKGRIAEIQNLSTKKSIEYLLETPDLKVFPERINPKTNKPYTQQEMLESYVPGSVTFTEKEANRITTSAIKKLEQNIKDAPEGYTPEIINGKLSEILTATRQLYKSSLGTEARLREDVRDIRSLFKRENVNKKNNQDMPNEQYDFLLKELPKMKNFEKGNVSKEEIEFLKKNKSDLQTGIAPVTGTVANKKTFTLATEEGMKKGSKVIVSMRNDLADFSKNLNKTAGHWTEMIGDPKYYGEVYYPGTNKLLRTGVLASRNRILYRKNSMVPSTYKDTEINVRMNKDAIGKSMEKSDVKYIVAEVDKVGFSKRGDPFMTIKIIPESYSISKAKIGEKELPKFSKSGEAVSEHLFGEGSFYSRLSKEDKIKLKNLSLTGKEKASNVISSKNMSDGYKHLSASMFKPLEKAFAIKDIKKIQNVFKETIGLNVSKEVANKFASEKELNVGKVIDTIEKARKRIKTKEDVKKIQEVEKKVKKIEKEKIVKAIENKEIKKIEKKKDIVEKAINKTDEGLTQDIRINKEKKIEVTDRKIGEEKEPHVNRNEKFEDENAVEAIKAVEAEKNTLKELSKKSPKDLDVFDKVKNSRTLRIVADPIKDLIKKARESNNSDMMKKVLKYNKKYDRDNLTNYAKTLYKKSKNNFYKSYEIFRNGMKKTYDMLSKDNNPFDIALSNSNKEYDRMFTKLYSKLVDSDSYGKLVFKNGKFETEIFKTPQPRSFLQEEGVKFNEKYSKEIKEFKEKNPKAIVSDKIELFYFDNDLSTFSKKITKDKLGRMKKIEKTPNEKLEELEKIFNKPDSEYVVIGLTDKKVELTNLAFMKRNDFFVKKFNENPSKYVPKEERIIDLSNGEKQIKVLGIDILGFRKETTARKIMKRMKSTDARNQQVKIDMEVKHNVIDGPTVQEFMKFSDKALDNRIKETSFLEIRKQSGKSWEEWKKTEEGKRLYAGEWAGYQKRVHDGIQYSPQEIIDIFSKATGMGTGRKRIKPTVTMKKDEQLMLLKVNNSTRDSAHTKYFETLMGGQKLGKNDVITFYDNVKEGEQLFSTAKGDVVKSIMVPARAYRNKFEDVHGDKGSFSLYRMNNLKTDKELIKTMKEWYKPKIDKVRDIITEITTPGTKIKDIFNKYEISLDGLTPQEALRIKHGADFLSTNKQMQGIVKNIIIKDIVKGVTKEGTHLTLIPSLPGIVSPGKIGVEHSLWLKAGKPKQMIVVRDPSNGPGSMLIADIVTVGQGSKHPDIKNLGKEQAMMHPEDYVIKMNADVDGDSIHAFFIGIKKGQIPKLLADKLKNEQAKHGTLFAEEPIKSKTEIPDFLNAESLKDSSRNALLAGEGIGKTNSTIRVLETLESAGTTIKTVINNGKATSFLYTGKGDKKKLLFSTKTPVKAKKKDGTYSTEFKYTSEKMQEAITMSQRTVDAQTDSTLRLLMKGSFDEKVLMKKLIGKVPEESEVKLFSQRINQLQNPHKLKKAKDYSEMRKKYIIPGNSKIKQIEHHGGEVGIVYEVNKMLGELPDMIKITGAGLKERRIQHEMRMAAKENTEKALSHRFSSVGDQYVGRTDFVKNVPENKDIDMKKVKIFINKLRNANKEYGNIKKRYSDEEIIKEKRNAIRKEFEEFWEEHGYKLNQGEKDALAFYIVTAEDVNYGNTVFTYINNNKKRESYFSIPEGVVNEASETVSRAYLEGIRNIPESLKKQIFAESKPQVLKQNINETQIMSSLDSLMTD